MKRYVVIAGVNGAGKTTLYSSETSFDDIEKINLDEEVRKIGDWQNIDDVIKGGKIVVEKINDYFKRGISFSQETTLCGNSIIRNIKKAGELGYYIELYYVGLANAEIAKTRVQYRVSQGGHGIPDEDIDRRYTESLKNFGKVLAYCDKVFVYDNTQMFRRIAIFAYSDLIWKADDIPEWFQSYLQL